MFLARPTSLNSPNSGGRNATLHVLIPCPRPLTIGSHIWFPSRNASWLGVPAHGMRPQSIKTAQDPIIYRSPIRSELETDCFCWTKPIEVVFCSPTGGDDYEDS